MSFPTVSIPGVCCFFFFLSPIFFTSHLFLYLFPNNKFARGEVVLFRKRTPELCSLSLYLWHLSSLHHLCRFSCFHNEVTQRMEDQNHEDLFLSYIICILRQLWPLISTISRVDSKSTLSISQNYPGGQGGVFSVDLNGDLSWLRGFPAECKLKGKKKKSHLFENKSFSLFGGWMLRASAYGS